MDLVLEMEMCVLFLILKCRPTVFFCFVLCCFFFTPLHHLVCCQSLIAFPHTRSVCVLRLLSKLNAVCFPAQFESMNKKEILSFTIKCVFCPICSWL